MGAPAPRAETSGAEHWHARVHTETGGVQGAGIVLGTRHVLTCAHVVPSPARPADAGSPGPWSLLVDAVGGLAVQQRRARVTAGGWVARQANVDHVDGGDLALLELQAPLEHTPGPGLHQLALRRGTQLWAYGFPHDHTPPLWALTVVLGRSGELVQVDPDDRPGLSIGPGFSGAGMVDEQGRLVGMVVSRLAGSSAGIAWMMPVETILRYLPTVAPWVRGVPAVPSSLREDGEAAAGVEAEVRRITRLLSPGRNTLIVVSGEPGNRRTVIRQLVATGSSGLSPPSLPDPIDLVVDAAGLSTRQVAARIAERLGAGNAQKAGGGLLDWLAATGRGVSVVVDDVDAAVDGPGLIEDLLIPLSELESGTGQVVLGVRHDPGISSRNSVSVRLPDRGPTGTFGQRLDELDRLISDLRVLEDQAAGTRREFTGAPAHRPRADALRLYAGGLRRLGASPQALAGLTKAEATAARALRRARDRVADEAERQELAGRLLAYQAKSVAAGRAEELALADLFAQAHAALNSNPCDLRRCRAGVLAYQSAVWQQPSQQPSQQPPEAQP